MVNDLIKKQPQHIRKYRSGRVTVVNRGIAKKPKFRLIGEGNFSKVYLIEGIPNKVFKRYLGKLNYNNPILERDNDYYKYKKIGLDKEPIFVKNEPYKDGMLIDRLRIVTTNPPNKPGPRLLTYIQNSNITDIQIMQLWEGLRNLSFNKIASTDFLQVGIGKDNKPYLYDIGGFNKRNTINDAKYENESEWKIFLDTIKKKDMPDLFPEDNNLSELFKTYSGKDIANKAKAMGSDQGGISDWLFDKISKEDYKVEDINISELENLDPDLRQYLSKAKIRPYKGKPFAMYPIVSSSGEVLDGYNRIKALKDKNIKISIYRGIKK